MNSIKKKLPWILFFSIFLVAAKITTNNLKVGRKTAENISIEFDKGSGSSNAQIRWNNAAGNLEFANDGTNFFAFEVGSGPASVFSTSSDYVISDSDGYSFILVTVGNVSDKSITLPSAANNTGREITIKRVDAGSAGSTAIDVIGTINGFTNTEVGKRYDNVYTGKDAWIRVRSDGTQWNITGTGDDIVYANSTNAWSTSAFNAVSVTLPPGKWQVTLFSYRSGGSSDTNMSLSVSTASTTLNNNIGKRSYDFFSSTTTVGTAMIQTIEDVTSSTPYYSVGITGDTTGLSASEHTFYALRIN